MSNECKHGLDGGLCAICFPKAVSEVATATPTRVTRARPAAKAPSLRSSPSPRTVTIGLPKPARATKPVSTVRTAVDNIGEQRIYHLTHIRNLAGIIESGCLFADASDAWTSRPVLDISATPTREARRSVLVAGPDSPAVAGYVPFFLSPNARLWDSLLTDSDDPRLSADAHRAEVYDFVILVSTVKKLRDAQAAAAAAADDAVADASAAGALAVAVTDGDAALPGTRFGATAESSDSALRRLRAAADSPAILEAELLVEEAFPFDLVTLVGVANDKVRDTVRGILAASPHRPKVAVYPPWFHASEDIAAL